MEKEKGQATSAINSPTAPAAELGLTKPCPEEPEIYVEADVPPYEEVFTLSGGCCNGS